MQIKIKNPQLEYKSTTQPYMSTDILCGKTNSTPRINITTCIKTSNLNSHSLNKSLTSSELAISSIIDKYLNGLQITLFKCILMSLPLTVVK